MKLNAKQLRDLEEKQAQGKLREVKRRPIYFILENIYDTYNIGGLFRLGDALAVEKIYLCGEMEIPPNHKIKKASIGTYKVVPWQYCKTTKETIDELRKSYSLLVNSYLEKTEKKVRLTNNQSQITIIAVEQHPKAVKYTSGVYRLPLALIFGNETYGILPETLKLADQIVEIPMWGMNKSLNVIVSAAIVSYWITTCSCKVSPCEAK